MMFDIEPDDKKRLRPRTKKRGPHPPHQNASGIGEQAEKDLEQMISDLAHPVRTEGAFLWFYQKYAGLLRYWAYTMQTEDSDEQTEACLGALWRLRRRVMNQPDKLIYRQGDPIGQFYAYLKVCLKQEVWEVRSRRRGCGDELTFKTRQLARASGEDESAGGATWFSAVHQNENTDLDSMAKVEEEDAREIKMDLEALLTNCDDLTDVQQDILRHVALGFQPQNIAAAFGMSASKVRAEIRRAISLLRKFIERSRNGNGQ